MFSTKDLIKKKRDGEPLSEEEIRFFIRAVADGAIPECQTGAMLMAIWQRGMVPAEIQSLTREMMQSGQVLSWPGGWSGLMVDKHSTGGVGDKVSLVLAPALAACGCKVPMISGRGLVHTGGTLDKLESIPGFRISQSVEQIRDILDSVGCCIVGQTEELVPADRVLYALRDATSTVDSLPLITGSIISKKGAESLSALVLDVKFGRAALYKDLPSAKQLAQLLMEVGNGVGIRTGAVLSRMDGTIGRRVGNSLEVVESLETLKGNGPKDLLDLVTTLGGMLLKMTDRAASLSEGKQKICDAVMDGAALFKFGAMMEAQGVAREVAQSLCSDRSGCYDALKRAEHRVELSATADGVVLDVDGLVLAQVLHQLGAGRSKPGDPINHSVGAELLVSLGQPIRTGEPWLRLHYEDPAPTTEQMDQLQNVLTVGGTNNQNGGQSLVAEVLLPD